MFEYTREFLINNNEGHLTVGQTSGKRFGAVADHLVVERMVNLDKKNITRVTKHPWAAATNESVTLNLSSLHTKDKSGNNVGGKLARLVITIRQEGKVSSLVNDQYPWHSKQYFYEGFSNFVSGGVDGTMPIDTWVAQATKEKTAEAEDRLITVSKDSGNLVIAANDCYTRIHEIRIVQVPDMDRTTPEALTGYQDYIVLAKWNKAGVTGASQAAYTAGSEGAGTVARILKNMRLQTAAHLDPYGLQRDERPLPTGKYTQYTIEYVVERRGIGSQVMGAIDKSLTSHLFFVESGAVSEFDTMLATLGLTVELATTASIPVPVIPVSGKAHEAYLASTTASIATASGSKTTVKFASVPSETVTATVTVAPASGATSDLSVNVSGDTISITAAATLTAGNYTVDLGVTGDTDKFGTVTVTAA